MNKGETTMEFKKGDLVECWDYNEEQRYKGIYFAINHHPKLKDPPLHYIHMLQGDGTTLPGISGFHRCRHIPNNLHQPFPYLHDKIMNLDVNDEDMEKAIVLSRRHFNSAHEILAAVYRRGHRDARHAAAELAAAPMKPFKGSSNE